MIRIAHVPTGPAEPPRPEPVRSGPFVVLPESLLAAAIEALQGFAHFAGDGSMLGRHDDETVHPALPASAYRQARAVRLELMEEYARED